MKRIDLTGQKFGKLTVIKYVGGSKHLCKCDCGNESIVFTSNLKRNHTKSCGCLNDLKRKQRSIDLTGKRFGNLLVLRKVKNHNKRNTSQKWLCKCDCGKETISSLDALKSGNQVSCGCYNSELHKKLAKEIDLGNTMRFDGTKISGLNRKLNSNSSSGHKGVYFDKNENAWFAHLRIRGKLYKQRCSNLNEAIEVRKELERKFHKPVIEDFNEVTKVSETNG